ncbi:hypothetical protein [Streptomyces sp. NPDC096013]|uniref:hypothetical protein n=1 Tax=Streptomyces sp. NPDC096013 TaxID=3366069 RepID=UPI0037F26B62
MPFTPRPHGQVTPALDDLNDWIRHLMQQPSSPSRSEEYRRLLDLWGERTRAEVEPAA